MRLSEDVIEKIVEEGIYGMCPDLDVLRKELRNLDLVVDPKDTSQSTLIENCVNNKGDIFE